MAGASTQPRTQNELWSGGSETHRRVCCRLQATEGSSTKTRDREKFPTRMINVRAGWSLKITKISSENEETRREQEAASRI